MTAFWLGVLVPVSAVFLVGAGFYLFVRGCILYDEFDVRVSKKVRTLEEMNGRSGTYYDPEDLAEYILLSPKRYMWTVIPGWSVLVFRNHTGKDDK